MIYQIQHQKSKKEVIKVLCKNITIEKLKNNINPSPDSLVAMKQAGCITEIKYMTHSREPQIRKINKHYYVDVRTGEAKEFQHTNCRADNKYSVAQSLQKLRDLLNANIKDERNCLWVTLTYKENMTDTQQIYEDFRKFNQRFQYFLAKNYLPKCEYITVAEPQGRGAWHMHVVFFFPCNAPFISNKKLAEIWGLGFVKIKSLKAIENPGLYLTAYLSDLELSDAVSKQGIKADQLKEVTVTDESGKKHTKAFIKGARLRMYPPGFRLFRRSKGIRSPVIVHCTEEQAMLQANSAKLVFEKTIRISDNTGKTLNTINYRSFNSKLKSEE